MVTRDFQNIVNDYINKLKSIDTVDKNEYNEKYSDAFDEFLSSLDNLQEKQPLLTHYDFCHLSKDTNRVIATIKKNASGKNHLDNVATCDLHEFKFGSLIVRQPRIINLEDKPNMVLMSSTEKSDIKYINDLLFNIILSLPLGETHVLIVNTSLSGLASMFIQNMSNTAYDLYTNYEEVKLLKELLNKRYEQKVVRCEEIGSSCLIVVLLDFDLNKRNYSEFSTLFERGKKAGIHFIVVANQNDVSQANTYYGNNLLQCKNYHLLNQEQSKDYSFILDPLTSEYRFYINQGVAMKSSEWNEELIKELKAKVAREIEKEEEAKEEQRREAQREREEERRKEESMIKVRFSCRIVKGFDDNGDWYSKIDVIDRDVYLSLIQGGSRAIANYILSEYINISRECSISEATMEKW